MIGPTRRICTQVAGHFFSAFVLKSGRSGK